MQRAKGKRTAFICHKLFLQHKLFNEIEVKVYLQSDNSALWK